MRILSCAFMSLALCAGVAVSGVEGCAPTDEMRALASGLGYEIISTSITPMSCGDVNGDERGDLCTFLVKDSTKWEAVCFVSRAASWKVESIAESSEAGLNTLRPTDLFLEVVRKGETLKWANGAAELTLHRDCVSFGRNEDGASLHCYNGAMFLYLQWMD